MRRHCSNGEGRRRGQPAAEVVTEAHRGRANFARKKFTGDGSIAGEEARAEKGDERAKKQEQDRASDNGVQRNENRSDEQVGEVGFATAERIRKKSERGIAKPLAGREHQIKGCADDEAQAAATFRDRKR